MSVRSPLQLASVLWSAASASLGGRRAGEAEGEIARLEPPLRELSKKRSRRSADAAAEDVDLTLAVSGNRHKKKSSKKGSKRAKQLLRRLYSSARQLLSSLITEAHRLPLAPLRDGLHTALLTPLFYTDNSLLVFGGLLVTAASETLPHVPKYNVLMILLLIVARDCSFLPSTQLTIRSHLTVSVLALLSLALDLVYIFFGSLRAFSYDALQSYRLGVVLKAFIAAAAATKLLAAYNLLSPTRGGAALGRVRKYLFRRLRIFFLPLREPRKFMRDVRARAIGLLMLHAAGAVAYLVLFAVGVTVLGYQRLHIDPWRDTSISQFLFFKALTSVLAAAPLLYDTDVVLAAAYFGLLGYFMKAVKRYVRAVYARKGGWPYPFYFNILRFHMCFLAKAVDFCWGVTGWVILSKLWRQPLHSSPEEVLSYSLVAGLLLLLTDVWGVVLYLCVYYLYYRFSDIRKYLRGAVGDSDDSELDEFGIRSYATSAWEPGPQQSNSAFLSNYAEVRNALRAGAAGFRHDRSALGEADEEEEEGERPLVDRYFAMRPVADLQAGPQEFSDLWELTETSAHFECQCLYRAFERMTPRQRASENATELLSSDLQRHLRSGDILVVSAAASQLTGKIRLLGYAEGVGRVGRDDSFSSSHVDTVLFGFELCAERQDGGAWSLKVTGKCTQGRFANNFIERLALAELLSVVG